MTVGVILRAAIPLTHRPEQPFSRIYDSRRYSSRGYPAYAPSRTAFQQALTIIAVFLCLPSFSAALRGKVILFLLRKHEQHIYLCYAAPPQIQPPLSLYSGLIHVIADICAVSRPICGRKQLTAPMQSSVPNDNHTIFSSSRDCPAPLHSTAAFPEIFTIGAYPENS